MSEVLILPCRPGAIKQIDKATLAEAGVIVVETDRPEDLQLIRAESLPQELSGGTLLMCAMKALCHRFQYQDGTMHRALFADLILKAIEQDEKKP